METKELGKLQSELPIGIKIGGDYFKNFGFKTWLWEDEVKASKLKEKGKSLGVFARELVVLMLSKIGNIEVTDKNRKDVGMILSQAYFSDVFYMYIYLRYVTMGENVNVDINCVNCNNKLSFIGDLNGLDVDVYPFNPTNKDAEISNEKQLDIGENFEAPIEDYSGNIVEMNKDCFNDYDIDKFQESLNQEIELYNGVVLDGEKYNKFIIHPCKWSFMDQINQVDDDSEMKKNMMKQSIIKIVGYNEDKAFRFSDDILYQMSKRDIEKLTVSTIKHNGGPDMTLQVQCKCGAKNVIPIDWTYENFFSASLT